MVTCFLRYFIDPDKLSDFELYARTWMRLIEKYGGTHHGYFLPDDDAGSPSFSFSGIGEEGPKDVAIALFSFPSWDAYNSYRRDVSSDPDCIAATARFQATHSFTKYERTFVRKIERD